MIPEWTGKCPEDGNNMLGKWSKKGQGSVKRRVRTLLGHDPQHGWGGVLRMVRKCSKNNQGR